jgi:hypothetical protein
MSSSQVDILLVEDSQEDLDLTLHVHRKQNPANDIHGARDGEEVLAFLLGAGSSATGRPRLLLLDRKLPKVNGPEADDVRLTTRAIPVIIPPRRRPKKKGPSERLSIGSEPLHPEPGRLCAIPRDDQSPRTRLATAPSASKG